MLLVGLRATWRADAWVAPLPLVLGVLLIVLSLVFTADLEELTWRWRNLLLTLKQRPAPGAEALGEIAEDLRELARTQAENQTLREQITELADKAKRAEAEAWRVAEAERARTRSIRPELHSVEEIRAGLDLQARVFDVIARVANERGWRVEGDLELYPAAFHANSSVDFAVVTDRGRILVETAPWTGGGITGHQRSVAVEFTKRYADAVGAYLVLPDEAFGELGAQGAAGHDVQVPGGPGRGDVHHERTRVIPLRDLESVLRALP